MADRGGRNNIVARRVIDDLIDISGERSSPKYLKIFIKQQITDHRRFIAHMRDEIRTSTNLISQLNTLIVELEAFGDYEEVFDLVMELRDDRRDEQDKVADFNRLIVVAEEKIHGKEIDLETLKAEGNDDQKKEIEPDEEPVRGTLWLKGRVNKDREYPDDEIRPLGDKRKETEHKIKEGTLKVDHVTDAMTVILGKEKGGYTGGVGSGVTYKSQFDNERRERQEKELLIQNLSNKMSQTKGMVSPVDINPINSSADEEGGTTVFGCENDASIQKSNGRATLEKEMETRVSNKTSPCETVKSVGSKKMTRSIRKDSSRQASQSQENVSPLLAFKCKLWHLKKSTIIALGTVYKTDGKQMIHNKELPKDCYKVLVDKSLVDAVHTGCRK
ncbi:hypothetical protein Tco_0454827 [Tanacetum coccineum]